MTELGNGRPLQSPQLDVSSLTCEMWVAVVPKCRSNPKTVCAFRMDSACRVALRRAALGRLAVGPLGTVPPASAVNHHSGSELGLERRSVRAQLHSQNAV